MRDGRLMLVGLDGAGKSTLADLVEGVPSVHRHREDCLYRARTLEVPGRYVENHWMHSILIMLAANQASAVALLVDASTGHTLFSSGYARALAMPCVGVLTKCAQVGRDGRERGERLLRDAGCTRTFHVDAATGDGVDEFVSWARAHAREAAA